MEHTLFSSAFNNCSSEKGPGFSARYWNNREKAGEPITFDQITTPFNFITTGATVFAPGVNLTDFSARYQSLFSPEEAGEMVFDFYACGEVNLIIDGEKVKGMRANHGGRGMSHTMQVEKGRTYKIEIDFAYTMGDAQLNFDLGFKKEIDIESSLAKIKDAEIVILPVAFLLVVGEEMGVNLPGFHRGDRTEIELPAVQRAFMQALHDAAKR